MPPDDWSPADKTLCVFFETTAFALGWIGVEHLFSGEPLFIGIGILVLSALVSYTGFKWHSLRQKIPVRYHRGIYITAVASIVLITAASVYRHYRIKKTVASTPTHTTPIAVNPQTTPATATTKPPVLPKHEKVSAAQKLPMQLIPKSCENGRIGIVGSAHGVNNFDGVTTVGADCGIIAPGTQNNFKNVETIAPPKK